MCVDYWEVQQASKVESDGDRNYYAVSEVRAGLVRAKGVSFQKWQ